MAVGFAEWPESKKIICGGKAHNLKRTLKLSVIMRKLSYCIFTFLDFLIIFPQILTNFPSFRRHSRVTYPKIKQNQKTFNNDQTVRRHFDVPDVRAIPN
jgi:hypothetical protein